MAEYSRLAKGSFTATGSSQVIKLPFQPDFVELWNYSIIKTPANHGVVRAWWDNKLVDGANNPTMIELFNATPVLTTDTIQTNGISAFSGGISLQYGPSYQHNVALGTDFSISKASPAVVTTATNHNLVSGDVVIFENLYQTSTTGMQQIAGIPFVITVTGATTFTIPWDTSGSNYTAFNTATSTGNMGSYKQVLFPALYAPMISYISGITLGASTVVALTMPGNFKVGQEVAFRIPTIPGVSPAVWGTTQLNSLPNILIPGSPVYGFVTAVSASLTTPTITVNINSSAFTAFNVNLPFANFVKEQFPQVVPVGDANSGSNQQNFLSPQVWDGNSNTLGNSINGPAISGAFINNTSQGFLIGPGTAATDTSASIMTSGNIILWHAYLHDFASP